MSDRTGYAPEEVLPLLEGKVPEAASLLSRLTVGIPFLSDFLTTTYLEDFIPAGGSKIKFVSVFFFIVDKRTNVLYNILKANRKGGVNDAWHERIKRSADRL